MNPRPAFWGVRCLRERGVRDVKGRQTKEGGGPEKEGGCRGKSIRRRDTGMEVMPHILHILYFTHPSTQRLHASIESMHNHSDSLGHTRTRQQSCSSDRGSDTYKAYHVCRSSLGLGRLLLMHRVQLVKVGLLLLVVNKLYTHNGTHPRAHVSTCKHVHYRGDFAALSGSLTRKQSHPYFPAARIDKAECHCSLYLVGVRLHLVHDRLEHQLLFNITRGREGGR